MTRIHRISLKVERREVSLSITQTATTRGNADGAHTPCETAQPSTCRDCGSPCLANFQTVLLETQIGLNLLQLAILDHRLHLQRGPDGHLWICERYLEQIKEAT
jgi:hypothetical protein